MKRIVAFLDPINEFAGKLFAWTTTLMVLGVFTHVILRYFFNINPRWLEEIEIYFFALCFLLGAGYAFKHDAHVRVDLFYANFSAKRKAWVNLIGGLLFLLPWCAIIIWSSYLYASTSYLMGETSPEPGGLPALYILKFSIMLGFILLFIQGLSSVFYSIGVLTGEIEGEEKGGH